MVFPATGLLSTTDSTLNATNSLIKNYHTKLIGNKKKNFDIINLLSMIIEITN
jgi:hypothetical protein